MGKLQGLIQSNEILNSVNLIWIASLLYLLEIVNLTLHSPLVVISPVSEVSNSINEEWTFSHAHSVSSQLDLGLLGMVVVHLTVLENPLLELGLKTA